MLLSIEPYNPAWKEEFQKIKNTLEEQLQGLVFKIEHIGSTSVPGIWAKPFLDIDIVIEQKRLLNEISSRLVKAGYINKGDQGIDGRFAFRQKNEFVPLTAANNRWQKHHLYVCFADSLAFKNHIQFRDALLQRKEHAQNYNHLKKELLKEEGITKERYTKRKTDFIISVLEAAGFETTELEKIKKANE
jgi:GrpB-like predicted nucleotidyltransferase (UPF0157 family)